MYRYIDNFLEVPNNNGICILKAFIRKSEHLRIFLIMYDVVRRSLQNCMFAGSVRLVPQLMYWQVPEGDTVFKARHFLKSFRVKVNIGKSEEDFYYIFVWRIRSVQWARDCVNCVATMTVVDWSSGKNV